MKRTINELRELASVMSKEDFEKSFRDYSLWGVMEKETMHVHTLLWTEMDASALAASNSNYYVKDLSWMLWTVLRNFDSLPESWIENLGSTSDNLIERDLIF